MANINRSHDIEADTKIASFTIKKIAYNIQIPNQIRRETLEVLRNEIDNLISYMEEFHVSENN